MKIRAAISRHGVASPVIEDAELDAPRADEVLVRLVATGICHTDLGCHSGHGVPVPKPIVLGHEGAGVVEAIGPGVQGLEPGDPVVLSGASCGICQSCRSGRPTYCREVMRLSFGAMRSDGSNTMAQPGGKLAAPFFGQSSFATHVVVAARSAVRVPNDVPLHLLGPLGCGIITGAASVVETMRLRPGESIVAFGAGSVGLAAIMAARLCGCSTIVAVEPSPDRRRLAMELGASHAVESSPEALAVLMAIRPEGFTFSFNTTRSADACGHAIACLSVEGTAAFVSAPPPGWQPDMLHLLSGGRRLQGILGGGANPQTFIPRMIEWWREGRFPFDRLIETFAFDHIGRAWDAAQSGGVIKPVLIF